MSAKPNIALLIFDIIFLPIAIMRLTLIYFFGSKHNINGMEFLDVMFHANASYFNQEVGTTIDVLHEDVRATIKRETKLFEEPEKTIKSKKIIVKTYESDEISIESETSINSTTDSNSDNNQETEKNKNQENNYDSENTEEIFNQESEKNLDIETEESHETTEAETVLLNIIDKKTQFDLDVHINQLFDDLENSVTTMTQVNELD